MRGIVQNGTKERSVRLATHLFKQSEFSWQIIESYQSSNDSLNFITRSRIDEPPPNRGSGRVGSTFRRVGSAGSKKSDPWTTLRSLWNRQPHIAIPAGTLRLVIFDIFSGETIVFWLGQKLMIPNQNIQTLWYWCCLAVCSYTMRYEYDDVILMLKWTLHGAPGTRFQWWSATKSQNS